MNDNLLATRARLIAFAKSCTDKDTARVAYQTASDCMILAHAVDEELVAGMKAMLAKNAAKLAEAVQRQRAAHRGVG